MDKQDEEKLADQFIAKGLTAIVEQISRHVEVDMNENNAEKRLHILDSIRHISQGKGLSLDKMHEIYEACITEALAIANGREKYIEFANVTSYNLAANLADCWDDAVEPRTTETSPPPHSRWRILY